jgi:chromosome segregation ATPase
VDAEVESVQQLAAQRVEQHKKAVLTRVTRRMQSLGVWRSWRTWQEMLGMERTNRVDNLDSQVAVLEEQILQSTQATNQQLAELQEKKEEIERLTKENEELEGVQAENEKLAEEKLEEVKSENEKLAEEKKDLEEQLKNLEEKLEKENNQNKLLAMDLADEKECLEHLTKELAEAKDYQESLLDSFEEEKQSLNAQIAAAREEQQAEIDRLTKEVDDLNEKVNNMERELLELHEIHSHCAHDIEALQSQLAEADDRAFDQREKLKEECEGKLVDAEESQQRLTEALKEIQHLEATIDFYRTNGANPGSPASPSRSKPSGRGEKSEYRQPFKVYAVQEKPGGTFGEAPASPVRKKTTRRY